MTPQPTRPEAEAAALGVEAELHDHHQLELRFNYAIGSGQGAHRYTLESYIFVPRSVGVNRANYPRETFYADATALMRLDATPLRMEELAEATCRSSPLHQLSAAVELFRASRRPPPSLSLATHVKLYAYLYAGAVNSEVCHLRACIEGAFRPEPRTAAEPPIEAVLAASLARLREGLWAFRHLRDALRPFEFLAHESFAETLLMADEYMSLFLEEHLAPVALVLAEGPACFDGTGRAARLRLAIAALLSEEARYRRRHGYLVVGEDGHLDGEYFTYRLSLLKKSIHQALYLNARTAGGDSFLRNAIGAVGAAIAAIWAILATPLPGTYATLSSGTQVFFFACAVLAYIMKDRAKALTNEFLTRRLRKYDHVFKVEGASLATMGLAGLRLRLSEAMGFVSSGEVPEAIRRLRLSRRTVRQTEAANEEVIRYRKELIVETKALEATKLAEGFRVRDIFRLSVRHFLVRLDDPLDSLVYFDARQGAFLAAQLPKVYHLNIVLRLERSDRAGRGQVRLERLRVVINKDGIVRVDTVESMGPVAAVPASDCPPDRR